MAFLRFHARCSGGASGAFDGNADGNAAGRRRPREVSRGAVGVLAGVPRLGLIRFDGHS